MSSATLFRVTVLVGAYVLIGHWAACGFFYISKWQARARLTAHDNAFTMRVQHLLSC
jgi:hypothetical protein